MAVNMVMGTFLSRWLNEGQRKDTSTHTGSRCILRKVMWVCH